MQQAGAGVWAAAVVMGILAAVFGVLYFHRHNEIREGADKIANANDELRRSQEQRQTLEKERDALKGEVTRQSGDLAKAGTQKTVLEREVTKLTNDLKNRKTQLDTKDAELKKVNAINLGTTTARETNLQGQLDAMTKVRNDERDRANAATRRAQNAEEALQAQRQQFTDERNDFLRRISSLTTTLDEQVARGTGADVSKKTDGRVISADIPRLSVVLNVGLAQNVRPGMRFTIVRDRFNRRDEIAMVEVTTVTETTAEAKILVAQVPRRVCPVTGYVAKSPEERYSPYARQTDPEFFNQVVELLVRPERQVVSMDPANPIIDGDGIVNPFFDPNRKLNFVLVGDPVNFSRAEIRAAIVQAGGLVQDEMTEATDFVVLGAFTVRFDAQEGEDDETPEERAEREEREARRKWEHDRTAYLQQRAERMGIPILREVDLFDFLRP